MSPIDIIAEEEVLCIGTATACLEKLQQIVELAVNIAAHHYRGVYPEDVGLALEYAFGADAKI